MECLTYLAETPMGSHIRHTVMYNIRVKPRLLYVAVSVAVLRNITV